MADIIAAHNAFIEGVYSSVQAQRQAPLGHLLPDELAKLYPSEVNDSSCTVGSLEGEVQQPHSLHQVAAVFDQNSVSLESLQPPCIHDLLQLVRSRYQPSSDNAPTTPQRHRSISPGLLETAVPEFQFSLLQEDIVACFLTEKPLICIEPSSLLHTLFKFRQSPGSVTAAGLAAE